MRLKFDTAGSKDIIKICGAIIIHMIFAKIVAVRPEITKICDAVIVHVIA